MKVLSLRMVAQSGGLLLCLHLAFLAEIHAAEPGKPVERPNIIIGKNRGPEESGACPGHSTLGGVVAFGVGSKAVRGYLESD